VLCDIGEVEKCAVGEVSEKAEQRWGLRELQTDGTTVETAENHLRLVIISRHVRVKAVIKRLQVSHVHV